MIAYLARRIAGALLTLLLASIVVQAALLAVPGDPAQVILGLDANPEALAALRSRLGLDRPPFERWLVWAWGALRGDLGDSLAYDRPVTALLAARLGVSVPLAIGAALLACAVALPLGFLAATRRGTLIDPLVVAASQLGAAVPSFWLGLMLVLLFAVRLGWLPAGGFVPWERDPAGAARSLALPVLALGLGQAAVMTRMTRAALLDVLALDYVRTARSKGLPAGVVLVRHALRTALVPLATIFGLSLGNVFIGSIVIERVFALPGMGALALTAIGARDYPLLQGAVLAYASAIVLLSLLVDLSYALLDPRVRYEA